MAKQPQMRVVGAVPSRPAIPPSEAVKQSLARVHEHVAAIKGERRPRRPAPNQS